MFTSAKQAEIIRSNQKDEYYSSYIKSSISDIIQTIWGPRSWLKWRQELNFLADLGYFGLTTFAGFQTLGEEYVNIVQVDASLRTIPTKWRRGFMILLHISIPYVIERGLSYVEKRLRVDADSNLTAEAKTTILNIIPVLRHTITILHRCHLAMFYMKGIFYHWTKRFCNIHYILVRDVGDQGPGSNYRILGWLSVIQLVFTFLQHLYKWSIKQRKQVNNTDSIFHRLPDRKPRTSSLVNESSSDPASKCVLCLEKRIRSTCTPCGHVFCWTCITEWCSNKPECPLCRESFQMSRLVNLQNYDPT